MKFSEALRKQPAWTAPLPIHQRVRAAAKAWLLREVERILSPKNRLYERTEP